MKVFQLSDRLTLSKIRIQDQKKPNNRNSIDTNYRTPVLIPFGLSLYFKHYPINQAVH